MNSSCVRVFGVLKVIDELELRQGLGVLTKSVEP
jgi:hypothetical protein